MGQKQKKDTPGTRGGPGGRAKILAETNFQPREFPRSGLKAKDGKDTPGRP